MINQIILQIDYYIVITDDWGFLGELEILFIQDSCQLQCRGNISLEVVQRIIGPLKKDFYKNKAAKEIMMNHFKRRI